MTVKELAAAKVNLSLIVHGKRADGFHDLSTIMLAIDLCDELELERRSQAGVALTVTGPYASSDIPTDASNLVVRAARAYLDAFAPKNGVHVRLTKNTPSQAGLGGGSSDAAATLRALAQLFDQPLDANWRDAQLAAWGSDCVFFGKAAKTGIALCEGRGERVDEWPPREHEWFVVVLTPDVYAATPAVFRALEFPLSAPSRVPSVPHRWIGATAREARSWLFNHLESAALRSVPGLNSWRELLDATDCGHFRLSGSGASFFGLFDTRVEARESLNAIERAAEARGLTPRGSWVVRAWPTRS